MRAPFQILAIPYRYRNGIPYYAVFRRSDSDQWQFLAGGGEDGETPKEAALRKIREESGICAEFVLQLDSVCSLPANVIAESTRRHWPTDCYVIPEYSFGFLCAAAIELSKEHTDCQWCTYEEASEKLTWDSNRTALYELNCRLKKQAECPVESMASFFDARANDYDEHMLKNVEGCAEGYRRMAESLPPKTKRLLDLGCGTGLELEEIFKRFPDLFVVGIDLSQTMLQKLAQKFGDKQLSLLCDDYFKTELKPETFDCAISFETMHHFSHAKKIGLYRKIYRALIPNGCYIECDYMVENREEEAMWFSEAARIRKAQRIPDDTYIHFDTPCTVENQIAFLKAAGFTTVEQIFRQGCTTILIAKKDE